MLELSEQMGGYRKRSEQTPFVQRDIPRGMIFKWSGSIAAIPPTFRLCDGTRGTPDLRDDFVGGAGDTFAVNETGGVRQHSHDFTSDFHFHGIGSDMTLVAGAAFDEQPLGVFVTGSSGSADKTPPFHSLVYMMYDGRPL